MKNGPTGYVVTGIYPEQFLSLRQCPRVGDSYFRVCVVESVHQTGSYTVKLRNIDNGSSFDLEYPDDVWKYSFYYCR